MGFGSKTTQARNEISLSCEAVGNSLELLVLLLVDTNVMT